MHSLNLFVDDGFSRSIIECIFIYLFIYLLVLKEKLLAPAQYRGCSGSRNIQDNISDLKAQVAANHKVYFKL